MQHFILPQYEITGKDQIQITDKDLLHQMKSVLRFKAGSECIVLDGKGHKANGHIEELHRKGAKILLSDHEFIKEPQKRVYLYIALSKKPSTFELILQKATELGVTDITPIVTERCQIKELRKEDRLHAIIREASEQSERTHLPRFNTVKSFNDALKTGHIFVGDARDDAPALSTILPKDGSEIKLLIGPEGGLTEKEIEEVKNSGSEIFRLGETILRMETAALAALSVVQFG